MANSSVKNVRVEKRDNKSRSKCVDSLSKKIDLVLDNLNPGTNRPS